MNTLHMGEQTGIIKGSWEDPRNADSLPFAATPHNGGKLQNSFLCGVANFLGGVGWASVVADTHLRHIAVALRQCVEFLVGSVDIRPVISFPTLLGGRLAGEVGSSTFEAMWGATISIRWTQPW